MTNALQGYAGSWRRRTRGTGADADATPTDGDVVDAEFSETK